MHDVRSPPVPDYSAQALAALASWRSPPAAGQPPPAAAAAAAPVVRRLASSTLVIANAVKVDTLDPEANSVNESIWLDQNLYSRLLQPNATGHRAAARPGHVLGHLDDGLTLHLPPAA